MKVVRREKILSAPQHTSTADITKRPATKRPAMLIDTSDTSGNSHSPHAACKLLFDPCPVLRIDPRASFPYVRLSGHWWQVLLDFRIGVVTSSSLSRPEKCTLQILQIPQTHGSMRWSPIRRRHWYRLTTRTCAATKAWSTPWCLFLLAALIGHGLATLDAVPLERTLLQFVPPTTPRS